MDRKALILVDDEPIILHSLREQLENYFGETYLYENAESAEEALEIIDELDEDGIEIAIIVSDWLMPGMKGDKFLLHIDLKYPRVVKLLLTGQADQESVNQLIDLADHFTLVPKPWEKEGLINAIKTGLLKNE